MGRPSTFPKQRSIRPGYLSEAVLPVPMMSRMGPWLNQKALRSATWMKICTCRVRLVQHVLKWLEKTGFLAQTSVY